MTANPQAVTSPAESAERLPVRWPIHWQLLVPMVAVVLLASLLATAITAYWIALRVRSDQKREDLRRVVETMGKSDFPKTRQVLDQVRGLSGAEFVLLKPDGSVRESTLPMEEPWLHDLARIAKSRRSERGIEYTAISLGDHNYLVDFVSLSGRAYSTEPATLFILYPRRSIVLSHSSGGVSGVAGGLDCGGHRGGDRHVACPAVRPSDSHAGGADGHDRSGRLHADGQSPGATTSCATWPNRSTA